jgi:hypothetical protein
MARLSIINEGRLVKTIELGAGEMIIGRGDDVAIQLKHPLISRRHARVYLTPAGYLVEDEGTKNGTFVRGRRVQRHRLQDGDEIEIADFLLQYHADGFVPMEDEVPAGGMVSRDRQADKQKSPLEAYMEALKRGGHNATAAIPPEAMAQLRDEARAKATPRLAIDGAKPVALEDRVTLLGFGEGNTIQLQGRWIWVNTAAAIKRTVTEEKMTITVERTSFWCPVRVNGKKIKVAEVNAGDKITVGKRTMEILAGDVAF